VDLIVMATQSLNSLDQVLLGSVTEAVVQGAKVPVLVLPRRAHRWKAAQPVQVLVPLDGSGFAERALLVGAGLARLLGGDLHLLRACAASDVPGAKAYLQYIAEGQERAGGPTVRTSVLAGVSAAATIRRYARDHGIALITLTSHGRSGLGRMVLGSIVREVLAAVDVPVAVVAPQTRVRVGKVTRTTSAVR
jgi:nucleotide-binding universal stress UspA family protein